MKIFKTLAAAMVLATATATSAFAEFPDKPLQIIVPTNPGGSVDNLARIFQRKIEQLGIFPSVVVINQPGAGGTIGTRAIKDAANDGYTIGLWSPGIITSKAMGVVDYDHSAFTVLGGTGLTEIGMGVLDASEIKDPGQLLKMAKDTPNSVVVATNIGLPVHFIPMMFADEADVELKFVQIGGGSKRLASILGGHTHTALFSVSEFKRYEESGLRSLFLFSEKRDPGLPNTPTAKESGVDLSISVFRVWLAPNGIGDAEKAKLQEVLQAVLADEEIRKELAELSIDPAWLSDKDVNARLNDMNARTEPLIKAARALKK
jgi:putative tricarboxylic transport membrane protein